LSAVVLLAITGCDSFFAPSLPGAKVPSEPIGSDFETATPLEFDAGGNGAIAGTINDDIPDVYDLGPFSPGDRIVVTVEPAADSLLDPTAAIFDVDGELFVFNDDEDLAADLLRSHIDEVVWIASDHYYLAISKFFLGNQGGTYQGTITVERGGSVSVPAAQYLLLNFAGGTVTIPNEGSFDMDPFDAADVADAYAGKTDEIKAQIVETVRQSFQDTGLLIITSDDPLPGPCTFSTVHFGGFSASKFGMAEAVDQGNRNLCDDGIIFTDGFVGDGISPFVPLPSLEGAGIAIGNVAAHEAGHLLGLSHVADVMALMDDTGTASTLLADQVFKTAPLSPTVFPIGKQNAPVLLERVVPP
jgi:hypothetical protein